jgi:ABC-2 type transport system permease protein
MVRFVQITKVQLAKMWGDPTIPMLIFIQPFMFSLLFGYLFTATGKGSQMITLFIGVGLMAMWQVLLFAGGIIVRHEFNREKTVWYNLISSSHLFMIWSSRLFACVILSTPSILVSLLVGYLVFGVTLQGGTISLILAGIGLYVFSLFSIGLPIILLLFLNPHGGKIIQSITYPIFLLSGMIISIDFFSWPIRIISYLFPITWSTHWLQTVMIDGTLNWTELWITFSISMIYLIASWFLFQYIHVQMKKKGEVNL